MGEGTAEVTVHVLAKRDKKHERVKDKDNSRPGVGRRADSPDVDEIRRIKKVHLAHVFLFSLEQNKLQETFRKRENQIKELEEQVTSLKGEEKVQNKSRRIKDDRNRAPLTIYLLRFCQS